MDFFGFCEVNETAYNTTHNFFNESPFHRSFAASVFIHGIALAGVIMVIHGLRHQKPFRLPQTITLISLPLPEKTINVPPPAPQRVRVLGAKKMGPTPAAVQQAAPLPAASPASPDANPVQSTNASQDQASAAPSAGVASGAGGGGEVGEPVRIGSIGNLDNVEFSPLYNPKPAYPLIALKAGIQGSVDVDLVINEFGRVDEFTIVNSVGHPEFGRETAKVIGKWRFPPPRVEGKKVKIKFLYTVNFKLD